MNLNNSLDNIIDEVNDSLFNNKKITLVNKKKIVQIFLNSSYSEDSEFYGMFDPTSDIFDKKIKLFTGERINTDLAIRNIFSLEIAKILYLFNKDLKSKKISSVLEEFDSEASLFCFAADDCNIGECAHSGLVYLNYFAITNGHSGKLNNLVENISILRDNKGGWDNYPFYYTIFTLMNIDSNSARDEIKYALSFYETIRKKLSKEAVYDTRRKSIMNKVLEDAPLTLM